MHKYFLTLLIFCAAISNGQVLHLDQKIDGSLLCYYDASFSDAIYVDGDSILVPFFHLGAGLFVSIDTGGSILDFEDVFSPDYFSVTEMELDSTGSLFIAFNQLGEQIQLSGVDWLGPDTDRNSTIAKLAPDLSPIWVKRFCDNSIRLVHLDINKDGQTLIGGEFTDLFCIDAVNFTTNQPTSNEGFLLNLDSAGNVEWSSHLHSGGAPVSSDLSCTSIGIDENGNSFFAFMENNLPLEAEEFFVSDTSILVSENKFNSYFGSINMAGEPELVRALSESYWPLINGDQNGFTLAGLIMDTIEYPTAGELYTDGTDLFLSRHDLNGDADWITQSAEGEILQDNFAWILETDRSRNIYLHGEFTSSLHHEPLPPFSTMDLGSFFLAKYDSLGNGQCIANVPQIMSDLLIDNDGFMYGAIGNRVYKWDENCNLLWDKVVATTTSESVGISTISNADNIELYPNPVSDILNITLPDQQTNQSVELSIFDLSGQEQIRSSHTDSNIVVSTKSLPSGTYLVQVRSAQMLYTGKISIVH